MLSLWAAGNAAYAQTASDAQSLYDIAVTLEHGEGVPRDATAAAALYCRAARDQHAGARYNLAWMYANGRGVPRHDGYAAHLFDLAASQGDAQAVRMQERFPAAIAEVPTCLQSSNETAQPSSPLPPPAIERAMAKSALRSETAQSTATAEPSVPDFVPPDKHWIAAMVRRHAPRFGIAPELTLAVIAVESNFDPIARSQRDALGLMQLIPETATRFKVANPFDPLDSVRGGLAYLRWLLAYYQGRLELALAAYNAGEGAVDRFGGVPPFAETRDYVRRILALYPHLSHPYDATVVAPSKIIVRRSMPAGIR